MYFVLKCGIVEVVFLFALLSFVYFCEILHVIKILPIKNISTANTQSDLFIT